VCFVPLIKRGNSGRPSAMPNYFGFYGTLLIFFGERNYKVEIASQHRAQVHTWEVVEYKCDLH